MATYESEKNKMIEALEKANIECRKRPCISCRYNDLGFHCISAMFVDAMLAEGMTTERSGNWILCYYMQGGIVGPFYLKCSECGRKVWGINQDDALKGNWKKLIETFPYCHCGAKMQMGDILTTNNREGV